MTRMDHFLTAKEGFAAVAGHLEGKGGEGRAGTVAANRLEARVCSHAPLLCPRRTTTEDCRAADAVFSQPRRLAAPSPVLR